MSCPGDLVVNRSGSRRRPASAHRRLAVVFVAAAALAVAETTAAADAAPPRARAAFNAGWRFQRGDPPEVQGKLDYRAIRDWVLPTGDELLPVVSPRAPAPAGEPGADVPFVRPDFDDSGWRRLDLPHDWGIEGPFRQ